MVFVMSVTGWKNRQYGTQAEILCCPLRLRWGPRRFREHHQYGVLRGMLVRPRLAAEPRECIARFVGKMLRDQADMIEEHTGFRIDAEWLTEFRRRRNVALEASLEAIPGVAEAVRALDAVYPGLLACASSADRPKIDMQLKKIGLFDVFEGRIFSGMELPKSKPAPDVYLAAARALGVDPAEAAVIEDSPTGVIAGRAAGSHVLGFCPDSPVHQSPETADGGRC